MDRARLARVSLLTSPWLTTRTLALIVAEACLALASFVLAHLSACAAAAAAVAAVVALFRSPPAGLAPTTAFLYDHASFVAYWLTLGVLSSIGLGSGLHTFVLFLGPHIVRIANAALLHGNTGSLIAAAESRAISLGQICARPAHHVAVPQAAWCRCAAGCVAPLCAGQHAHKTRPVCRRPRAHCARRPCSF